MNVKRFPNGWYGEALPTGEFAVLFTDSHIQTHLGNIPLPGENVLYLRITNVGGFKMAGQGGRTNVAWLYENGTWRVADQAAVGVSPCIFRNGALVVSHGEVGSQGYRYVRPDGSIATGDQTYSDIPNEIWEWTEYAGIKIGQGQQDCQLLANGKRYTVESGDARFIRVNGAGSLLAITICKFAQRETVIKWIDMTEIPQLPVVAAQAPPPQPTPTPKPEPPKPTPMSIPNHLDTLKAVRAKYPELVDRDQAVAILNEVAWIHRAEGFGLLAKPGGNHGAQPRTGTLCSIDWLVHRPSGQGFDAGVDGPDEKNKGALRPVWGSGENFDLSRFVAPVEPLQQAQEPSHEGEPGETPAGPAVPVSVDVKPILDKIEEATKRLEACSQAEIAKLDEMKVAVIKSTGELKDALEKILPLLVGGGAGAGILGGIFGKKK